MMPEQVTNAAIPVVRGNEIFCDANDWCESALDWELDLQQLDRGPLNASMQLAAVDGLAVQRVSLDRRFHQSGKSPAGTITVAFPDDPGMVQWFGAPCLHNGLQNFSLAKGFDSVNETVFTAHTVSIPAEALLSEGKALGCDIEAHHFSAGPEQFQIAQTDFGRFRALVSMVRRYLHGQPATAEATTHLVADIRTLLAMSLADASGLSSLEGRATRQTAVDRAVELIRATEGMATLAEVCQHAAISARSLSRGFSERFGVATKQYMVAVRLEAVRRRLQETDANVTEAACASGFWHLGRFSSDYRDMFGELPSETKSRAPRRTRGIERLQTSLSTPAGRL